jgi:Uma2 family endonuclease
MATVTHPHIEPGEYLALQTRAGWRLDVELIDGEGVVVPPTGRQASSVQGELFFALRRWQERTADEGLTLQDVFVAFPGWRYLAPDIAWWSAERRPPHSDGAVDRIPDLVVEVLSPATRVNDLGIKREVYMRSGVKEMWLVDPDARTVTRVQPGTAHEEVLGQGELLRSDLLNGFALQVASAFRALQRPPGPGQSPPGSG